MKKNDTKKIYINLSNISTGGAIQVAMSFIDHMVSSEMNNNFYFFFSKRLQKEINNSHLAPYLNQLNYRIVSKHSMFFYFSIMQPKKIFTLFGPLYAVKLLSGRNWISGFAQAWILFPKNRVYEQLNKITRLKFKIIFSIQKAFFTNSNTLIVEHEGIKAKLQEVFKNKKIVVAKNCLNQIFLNPTNWKTIEIPTTDKLKIGVIGRNYTHKNLNIIPSVHNFLEKNHSIKSQFYCTLTSTEMNKMSEEFKKKVISLGELNINQCPNFYNNMDVIFFPSNLESFSATPLEALYMNKNIVCSNLPFNKNIIGKFGIYFEPNNPISAAEKIASTLKKQIDGQLKEAKKFVFSNFKSEDRFKIYINTILKDE
jgi:glycosyltransferase involved in cell wall biosynthesis